MSVAMSLVMCVADVMVALYLMYASALVSMAPLSQEVQSISSCVPPHLGPAVTEVTSVWFKLWLYSKLGTGPNSILLSRGTRLRKLPAVLKVTTAAHNGLQCMYYSVFVGRVTTVS